MWDRKISGGDLRWIISCFSGGSVIRKSFTWQEFSAVEVDMEEFQ